MPLCCLYSLQFTVNPDVYSDAWCFSIWHLRTQLLRMSAKPAGPLAPLCSLHLPELSFHVQARVDSTSVIPLRRRFLRNTIIYRSFWCYRGASFSSRPASPELGVGTPRQPSVFSLSRQQLPRRVGGDGAFAVARIIWLFVASAAIGAANLAARCSRGGTISAHSPASAVACTRPGPRSTVFYLLSARMLAMTPLPGPPRGHPRQESYSGARARPPISISADRPHAGAFCGRPRKRGGSDLEMPEHFGSRHISTGGYRSRSRWPRDLLAGSSRRRSGFVGAPFTLRSCIRRGQIGPRGSQFRPRFTLDLRAQVLTSPYRMIGSSILTAAIAYPHRVCSFAQVRTAPVVQNPRTPLTAWDL